MVSASCRMEGSVDTWLLQRISFGVNWCVSVCPYERDDKLRSLALSSHTCHVFIQEIWKLVRVVTGVSPVQRFPNETPNVDRATVDWVLRHTGGDW